MKTIKLQTIKKAINNVRPIKDVIKDDMQNTIERILYNFKALEWIDTSNTDNDDGIIITIGMKDVEYKVEDLEYEIWLLLEQTKYQMKDYNITPKYVEDICLLEITHK